MNRRWLNSSHQNPGTYASWAAMNRRCYNSEDKDFPNYGSRGIQVCDRWRNDFDAFVEDMGLKPFGLTIERINTDGNYGPGNCRWATRREQSNNLRNNRMVGDVSAAEAARQAGLTRQAILGRLDRGLSARQASRYGRLIAEVAQHGTISRYTSKKHSCRCGECREAWRLHNAKKRSER